MAALKMLTPTSTILFFREKLEYPTLVTAHRHQQAWLSTSND